MLPALDATFWAHARPLLDMVEKVPSVGTLTHVDQAAARVHVQAIVDAGHADWAAGWGTSHAVAYVRAVGRWASVQPRPVVEPLR